MPSNFGSFDGLDNRREIMILLERLGSDAARARFLESLIPKSLCGFANAPMKVKGNCDAVAAYFMLIGITNELRVPIDTAARLLEDRVRRKR